MKNKIVTILILHLAIIVFYISITSYFFVVSKDPNPIGSGFQQVLLIILHVGITFFTCAFIWANSKDKKNARRVFIINICAVIFWVVVYITLSEKIDGYLWTLRK